jgi:hypothetical protein
LVENFLVNCHPPRRVDNVFPLHIPHRCVRRTFLRGHIRHRIGTFHLRQIFLPVRTRHPYDHNRIRDHDSKRLCFYFRMEHLNIEILKEHILPYVGGYQFRFVAGVNRTFYSAYTMV